MSNLAYVRAVPPDMRLGVPIQTYWASRELSPAQEVAALAAMGAKWYKRYLPTTDIVTPGCEFVPQIPTRAYFTPENLAACASYGTMILSYNEPDTGVLAPIITPAQAAADWPQFVAAKATNPRCRLACPAVTDPSNPAGWLAQFFALIDPTTVDVIPLHFYTAIFTSPSTAWLNLVNVILGVYKLFHKPMWIDEWGMIDFAPPTFPTNNAGFPSTVADVQASMVSGTKLILQFSYYIERSCWYPCSLQVGAPPPQNFAPNFFNDQLVDQTTGLVTAVGTTYATSGNLFLP